MYLLDTNILLELLLNQKKADEVERLLLETPPEMLSVSEFTIDSIGVILIRRIMHDIFLKAVEDMLLVGGIRLMRIGPEDMQRVVLASRRFKLDYDDAYQYALAEKYNLILDLSGSDGGNDDYQEELEQQQSALDSLQSIGFEARILLSEQTGSSAGRWHWPAMRSKL
ncbi:PIN domain-containing protein [Methanothrix soehngenii]|uniref:PIN domain-containing protein n=2 Tax=Methanothrix soehngenii TaxID=2223 RepID=UPI002FD8F384